MFLEIDNDLGDTEQAHRDRREVDAVAKLGHVEGEALRSGVHVGADEAEQQPEEHHRDRLGDRPAGQDDGCHETERHQGTVVGWAELLRHERQRLGKQHDDDRSDGAREERADGRNRQRGTGTAIAGHLIAVETGHDRRRLARQVHQDRRRRTAIGSAVIDAGEHDQRSRRRQMEGDGQQHGDGRHRSDAGKDADQRAEHAPQEGIGQVL